MTDAGLEHHITAQVTDVNKALLSVSTIVSKGCRVVFDEDNIYIENKSSEIGFPLNNATGCTYFACGSRRHSRTLSKGRSHWDCKTPIKWRKR